MQIITIQFNDKKESQFVMNLLRRLNIHFEWKEEKMPEASSLKPDPVTELFGSWVSDKSSDEQVQSIYEARINQNRAVTL